MFGSVVAALPAGFLNPRLYILLFLAALYFPPHLLDSSPTFFGLTSTFPNPGTVCTCCPLFAGNGRLLTTF
jgi:hypothetical protein